LYQNEESNGRQYPTPIGNIDLLAIDKKNKEFVVIELKKGRSSDAVIGQILRYMGWVKDKLALSAYSDAFRPLIPIDSGHLFRSIPAIPLGGNKSGAG
jgi:hypothetical protein